MSNGQAKVEKILKVQDYLEYFWVSFSIVEGAKINGTERENMQRMQICKAQNVPDIPSELLNCTVL